MLDDWCAELAGCAVPDSVQHDDLHSANVCWPGTAADARVIDWGDATWGHPLGTMLATLNSIAFHAGTYVDERAATAPELLRVRDAYLELFSRFADHADLVAASTWPVVRDASGRRWPTGPLFTEEPLSTHVEMEFPVREWFLALLED